MTFPKKKQKLDVGERRKHVRTDIEVYAQVELLQSNKKIPVTIHDISEGGAFIETQQKFLPGELIKIAIELAPGLITIQTQAKIIYTTQAQATEESTSISTVEAMESYVRRGHLEGAGIQFLDLSKKDQSFLHNFVAAIS
ncbi:MAG: PilZ domain-containing protein [Deltaproteobacteria bacterium]|nr:PilZ domain-containing protein [Deltaproteobacteria bacterium]